MNAYQANGARLGWLLLPHERVVEIWPASGEPKRIDQAEVLEGWPEFPGLRLELGEIWNACSEIFSAVRLYYTSWSGLAFLGFDHSIPGSPSG